MRYTDTLFAIAQITNTQPQDTETLKLLDLMVFSVFYDESSYRAQKIEERINQLLYDLSLSEESLEAAFVVLFAETMEYLPRFRSHQSNHCLPSSCIQKTSKDTYTLLLDKPIAIEMSTTEYNQSIGQKHV